MKDCPTCDTPRDRAEFYSNASRPDGLHGECRYCAADRRRRDYWANVEVERARNREHSRAYRARLRAEVAS